jgi:hypothetical protein
MLAAALPAASMRQMSTIITSKRIEYMVKNFSGFRCVELVHSNDWPKLICRPSFVVPV